MKFIHTYQSLPSVLFCRATPASAPDPKLVIFNQPLASSLHCSNLANADSLQLANWLSGNELFANAQPIAQAYAGHQFSYLNILGDGRALLLGELQTENGLIDLQLKGSGRTPYSRQGDGKATLAPMLREYLLSEAMYALTIPTTRSLAVVTTGKAVYRNGIEQCAVLTRTAQSHLRVGTFVYANMLAKETGDISVLKQLLDYACERHYPKINDNFADDAIADKALALLDRVMDRQAKLVAHWQRVGFIHGVMNTDNITITGETIDYGPCAFMDSYNERTVYSSIDQQGRYAFGNQMPIMWWNMARFAESLLPLIDSQYPHSNKDKDSTSNEAVERATAVIDTFGAKYQSAWQSMLCAKLGLVNTAENFAFGEDLLSIMQANNLDYTNTFIDLTLMVASNHFDITDYQALSKNNEALTSWLTEWQQKLTEQNQNISVSLQQMQANNPTVIPRNHLVDKALTEAEAGDMDYFHQLLSVLQTPYDWDNNSHNHKKAFQQPAADDWNAHFKTYCGT